MPQEHPSSWIPDPPVSKPKSWIPDSLPNNPPSARSYGPGPRAFGVPPKEEVPLPPIEEPPPVNAGRNWWQHLTQAPEFITEGATDIANWLTTPVTRKKGGLTSEAVAAGGVEPESKAPLDLSKIPAGRRAEIEKLYRSDEYESSASPMGALIGGGIEGASQLFSPANIILTAVGGGEVAALNRARGLIAAGRIAEAGSAARTARNLETITRIASVPVAAHAGAKIVDPNSTKLERLAAVPELAGAILGVRSRVRPTLERTPVPNLSGMAAEATPDIPLKLSESGTFVPEDLDLNVPIKPRGPEPTGTDLTTPIKQLPAAPKTRFPSVVLHPGPSQMGEVLRLGNEGYRVVGHDKDGNIKMVPKETEFPAAPETDEPQLSRVINPKQAIIEDLGPKWEGYGPNGEDYFNVAVPRESGESGELAYSHGILDEDTVARLKAEGFELVRRSELEPQKSRNIHDMEGGERPVRTFREMQLERVMKIEDPVRRQEELDAYHKALEEGPEHSIEYFRESQSPRRQEAESIYAEQDPQAIAENYQRIHDEMASMADAAYEHRNPAQQRKFDNDYEDLATLHTLAQEKYERTSQRMMEGRMDFSRAVDESGQPIDVAEWTPEQLEARKKDIRTAWYNARKEAADLGVDIKGVRDISEVNRRLAAARTGLEPQKAKRIAAEGLNVGVNVKRSARELSTGYSQPLPGIMVREGLQNALDAMKAVGGGEIYVEVNENGITVSDKGKGMTLEQLKTVYKDLNESGKIDEAGATGGKGVGKASYMLGGGRFSAETVVKEKGKKIRYTLEGTPDELMENYNIMAEDVPMDTQTGTSFTTEFTPEQQASSGQYYANNMLSNIQNFSRNIPVSIKAKRYGFTNDAKPIRKFTDDKILGATNIDGSNVSLYVPKDGKLHQSTYLNLQVLNNGMYQFSDNIHVTDDPVNLPDNVIVEVKPGMEEGHTDYPFPVQRENIKEETWNKIVDFVKLRVANPYANQQRRDLMDFWDDLPLFTPDTPTTRPALFFDVGSRLTPEELTQWHADPFVNNLMSAIDNAINNILVSANPGKIVENGEIKEHDWSEKVQHVGLILDDGLHGIHIPDPRDPKTKSAILINPFNHMAMQSDPRAAAMDIIVTSMHEAAHVGRTVRPAYDTNMLPEDLQDPMVGEYLQAYLRHVKEQGGIDMGHGMDFVKRLGDVWVTYGTGQATTDAARIIAAIGDPASGDFSRYSPEVQDLIHKYTESRRRDETKADILSRTGIKSAVTGSGKAATPRDNAPDGEGVLPQRVALKNANTKKLRQAALDAGLIPTGYSDSKGNPIWERPKDLTTSKLNELWNLPRGLMSVDLPFITSAALRQGLPLIGLNFQGWIKAWGNAARAYTSEQASAGVAQELSKSPLLQRGRDAKERETPSYAEKVGLELTDTRNMNRREEVIKSKWAEKIPIWGRHVAGSNRAYTAFLNTLRVGSLEKFVQQTVDDAKMMGDPSLNAKENIELGKSIADAINVLSGRGKLEMEFTPKSKRTKQRKYSVERAARTLVDVFFSPRLLASRMKMLNINTYISADPFTRKLYIKGLLSAMATWWSIAALLELAGWEVGKDPNSADFGKAKLDNTRIDPGGGFQQFLVLGSRLRPEWAANPVPMPFPPYGEMVQDPGGQLFKSSTSGERARPLGEGFRPITPWGLMLNFGRSKLHPSAAFVVDMLDASNDRPVYVGDRIMQMAVPMMTGDLAEVLQENPSLIPAVVGAGSLGMGASTYEGGPTKPQLTPFLDQLGIPATDFDPVLGR
jgi:hypothetical protein